MKLTVLSDIHLEFGPLELPGGDTLLLAGDICVADVLRPERTDARALVDREKFRKFFFEECAKYNRVFYIAGNHEHYHGDYKKTFGLIKDFIKGSNVDFLEDECRELDDKTVLFGGTMWTSFNNGDWFALDAAKRGMNDFHIVSYGEHRFLPNDALEINRKSFDTLKTFMQDVYPDKEFVVMTHHAPTPMSCHPRYKHDKVENLLNHAYQNNYSDWMLDKSRLKYWFHGHTHDSHDYVVGNCRVICNPRGYWGYSENMGFDLNKTFEV